MTRLKVLDLFAGCGGLAEGFESQGAYQFLAAVEWEKAPRNTLANRLKTQWKIKDAEQRVLCFDIQRTNELFSGWADDPKYGSGEGLDSLINNKQLDVVIGGPPCQAYSLAGRIRDKNGMRDDYRNYLFESYLKVINRYKPKAFIFENVPGILSACPSGSPIVETIREEFTKSGWYLPPDLKRTIVDMSEYGIPQRRRRLILLGLSVEYFGERAIEISKNFYENVLPQYKRKSVSVEQAIGDLPKLYPIKGFKNKSHGFAHAPICPTDHLPRYHSERDIEIFRLLARDIQTGSNNLNGIESLKALYTKYTGRVSNVHKYHVLKANQPSTIIPAHLQKDGLRHIHPDPGQARSITVREAARLQGFPDDFIFLGTRGEKYKMIGNAVPPLFANIVAEALHSAIKDYL